MIPKIWNKKLKKCSKCGDKSILNGWVTQRKWADDIGGRIFCPICNKFFEIQEFGESRYKVWKMLVDGWNNINQSGGRMMVHERIHIICGNCGQDLTEKGMATWQYIPAEVDEETGEVYDTADVYIKCENCATIHFLDNHIKAESEG